MYSALLNLAKYPAVRYLRVEWKMRRWGNGNPVPNFGFSVFTERSGSRVSAAENWKDSAAHVDEREQHFYALCAERLL